MNQGTIKTVNRLLKEILSQMFNTDNITIDQETQRGIAPLNELLVYTSVKGELFECHLVLGFTKELGNSLLSAINYEHESTNNLPLIDSLAGEIGNTLAAGVAADETIKAVLGNCQIQSPKVWDCFAENEMFLPMENGEFSSLHCGEHKIDTFICFRLQQSHCSINYHAMDEMNSFEEGA